MSIYDRMNFNLSRIPEREDMFIPNRPTVTDTPLSNVTQPPVFNQLTPEQQQALQNLQNPAPVQVDLGGGLGGFTMPQIPLETILANLPDVTPSLDFSNLPGAPSTTPPLTVETLLDNIPENFQVNLPEDIDLTNLEPTIFGTPLAPSLPTPPVFTPAPAPVPAPAPSTVLEDTGASEEVIEDVDQGIGSLPDYPFTDPETGGDVVLVVGEPGYTGPGVVVRDPETGELPPGFSDEGVSGPAGTVVEPYTPPPPPPPPSVISEAETAIPPSVTPAPTPATDVVTGEDIPLITPQVSVPQESLTGLGSYFTTPQINQIVNPGYRPPSTTDMDRLLQLQRESFRNFLVQPAAAPIPAPSPSTGTATSEGDAGGLGMVGTAYNRTRDDLLGRDYIDGLYNDPTGIQFGMPQNQMYSGPIRSDIGGYYTAYNPAQDMRNGILNNIYNRGYGVMDFPVFSGITSLVPSDARATIGR